MNRWFPRSARKAPLGGAAVFGAMALAACTPNNSVEPGAPVLTQLMILQAGVSPPLTITGTTPDCTVGLADGAACFPKGQSTDADGGLSTPDTLCHLATSDDWCTCTADATDPTTGLWGCAPFSGVVGVLAIFDRVISTAPFDMADGGASTTVARLEGATGPSMPSLVGDYGANGSDKGLLFPLYGSVFFNNFRNSGPSILLTAAPTPALPSDSKLTVTLNKSAVTAKDGHTPFTGHGLLMDGSITFKTTPFTADIAAPPPAPGPDGGPPPTADSPSLPDNTPATVTFTNLIDVTAIAAHIEVTAGGSVVPVDVASTDNMKVTLTPKTTWPADATIQITVDANAADLLGETLGAADTKTFKTTAM